MQKGENFGVKSNYTTNTYKMKTKIINDEFGQTH